MTVQPIALPDPVVPELAPSVSDRTRNLLPFWVPKNAAPFRFSLFDRMPVRYEYVWYQTAEHAYQASKTDDDTLRREIQFATRPSDARRIGSRITPYEGWEEERYEILGVLIDSRFRYKPAQLMLMRHDPVKEPIVYWNLWHDTFLGCCICERCRGDGSNVLGALIEATRLELIATSHQQGPATPCP